MANYECENRISDDEIISSLEVIATTRNCSECKIRNCSWGDCNCSQITANAALDLIKRQKAEIERLKECPKCIYEYDGDTTEYCVQGPCSNFKTVEQIKSEAYKEFADRLLDKVKVVQVSNLTWVWLISQDDINDIIKEMLGEE